MISVFEESTTTPSFSNADSRVANGAFQPHISTLSIEATSQGSHPSYQDSQPSSAGHSLSITQVHSSNRSFEDSPLLDKASTGSSAPLSWLTSLTPNIVIGMVLVAVTLLLLGISASTRAAQRHEQVSTNLSFVSEAGGQTSGSVHGSSLSTNNSFAPDGPSSEIAASGGGTSGDFDLARNASHHPHPTQPRQPWQLPRAAPYVIAHRGASGMLPEHTIPAYQLAIEQGADFIECDVVLTKDLHPICRHEPELSSTTDASTKFPDRIKTIKVDGEEMTGVFASDLTLQEVSTLRAVQRLKERDQQYNGRYPIPRLQDFLDVAQGAQRVVGIYPEVKHPTWYNSLPQVKAANTTIEDIMLRVLLAYGYGKGGLNSKEWLHHPVFIQCFETGSLEYLHSQTCMPLILLMGGWPGYVQPDTNCTHEQMTTDAALDELVGLVSGVGPWKDTLVQWQEGQQHGQKLGQQPVQKQKDSAQDRTIAAGGEDKAGMAALEARDGRTRLGKLAATAAHAVAGLDVRKLLPRGARSAARAAASTGTGAAGDAAGSAAGAPAGAADAVSGAGYRSTGLVERLHARGLQVHPYTIRDESHFWLPHLGSVQEELQLLLGPGSPAFPTAGSGAGPSTQDASSGQGAEPKAEQSGGATQTGARAAGLGKHPGGVDGVFADYTSTARAYIQQHQGEFSVPVVNTKPRHDTCPLSQ